MTVIAHNARNQYTATNGQTIFSYTFEIAANTDIEVYQRAAGSDPDDIADILTLTTDYSVTGVGGNNGGTIVLVSGATTGDIISIQGAAPAERDTSFTTGGVIQAANLNVEFDNDVLIYQTILASLDLLTPKYAKSAVVQDFDVVLPILPANCTWVKNAADDEIVTYDLSTASGILPGSGNDLAVYQANGIELGPLATVNSSILTTTSLGVPTWQPFPLPIVMGGTGVTSVTVDPTVRQYAGWDDNKNLSATRFVPGYRTTATSGGTTTLLITDVYQQYFTGSMTHTVVMPVVASPLVALGDWWMIVNKSSGAVTVQSSGGNTIQVMAPNTTAILTCIGQVATDATSWNVLYEFNDGSAGIVPAALSKTDDTNVTLSLGGSPTVALLQATSLTLGWTGTLAATRGGTGAGTYTLGDTLYSSAANTLSKLAGNITAVKQYLSQTGDGVNSAAPSWATVSGGDITGAALTKVDDTNVTLTLAGTPATALLRAASITAGWTGILAIARGGTGVSSVTVTPVVSTFAGWDTNKNLSANRFVPLYTTTATAAGTTTLDIQSTYQQYFTGSTTQTVVMPVVASPLIILGDSWLIVNKSSGAVTVQSSGGNTIKVMAANTSLIVTCVGQVATDATSWNFIYEFNDGAAGVVPAALTKTDDTNVTVTLGGTPATALLQAASLTMGWTGQLSLARGGSNANLTASIGGIVYSTASAMAILAGTATAGQMVQSGSSAAPTWSTTTYPATNAINTLLYASSANVMSALATANSGVLVTSSGGVPSISSTLPAFTTSSITFSPTTGGIVGTTTNDSAAAGKVGEFVSSVIAGASAISLTNITAADVTSISLTAGDWVVWGNVSFPNNTGTCSAAQGWVSSTSATQPDVSIYCQDTGIGTNSNSGFAVTERRFSLSGTTTVYLSALAVFTVGLKACGGIYARRPR